MSIAHKDWLEFVRDWRLVALAALALVIALAAIVTSSVRVAAYESDRAAAQTQEVATWNNQGARNPHSAAHFGAWALRPLTALTLIDPGVTPYAGNAVYLEAHSWNPARVRPADDQESVFDLGTFSVAWMLQLLLPLVIFVIAAGLIARERERGTLRLLLANGVTGSRLVRGKFMSLARIAGIIALPVLASGLFAVLLAGGGEWLKLLLWCATYLAYLLVIVAIALAVSALTRTGAQALLILVGLWLFAILLVPRGGAALAQLSAPVPAPDAFWGVYRDERKGQPNVFVGAEAEAFKAETLRRYRVSRPEDLPVSLGGLQLEEDERIGNAILDRLYGDLNKIFSAQRDALRWASLLSPLPAVQNLSQTFAGTSMPDQIDFQRQAESHRRRLVTFLNMDLVRNGAGTEYDYLADGTLWRRTPQFAFKPSALATTIRRALPDALILLGWVISALGLVGFAARRLARESL